MTVAPPAPIVTDRPKIAGDQPHPHSGACAVAEADLGRCGECGTSRLTSIYKNLRRAFAVRPRVSLEPATNIVRRRVTGCHPVAVDRQDRSSNG